MAKVIKKAFSRLGYDIRKKRPPVTGIPDAEFYTPVFCPWLGYGEFKHYYDRAKQHTIVSMDRFYTLFTLASQALSLPGDIWECGVYKGGTAILFAELIASKACAEKKLHLFDTFQGMPETDPEKDLHRLGDFADTSLSAVMERVGRPDTVRYHPGFIPETFAGLETAQIAFAHIDVDIYQSILDCCQFILPRLTLGGFMVFDDYGFPSCPGARAAVDEFFKDRPEKPLVLSTGQAIIFKSSAENSDPLPKQRYERDLE